MKATVTADVSSYCLGISEWFNYETSFGSCRQSEVKTNQTTVSSSSFTYNPTIKDGESAVRVTSIVAQGFKRSGPTRQIVYLNKKIININ